MALANILFTIGLRSTRARTQMAVVGAETHGATHVADALLLLHQVDYRMAGARIHLCGVGIFETHHVAGEFDHHALHAETDAEGGHVMLAAPFQGHELAFDASLAKAWGHDHAVKAAEFFVDIALVEFLGMHIHQVEFVAIVCGSLE